MYCVLVRLAAKEAAATAAHAGGRADTLARRAAKETAATAVHAARQGNTLAKRAARIPFLSSTTISLPTSVLKNE